MRSTGRRGARSRRHPTAAAAMATWSPGAARLARRRPRRRRARRRVRSHGMPEQRQRSPVESSPAGSWNSRLEIVAEDVAGRGGATVFMRASWAAVRITRFVRVAPRGADHVRITVRIDGTASVDRGLGDRVGIPWGWFPQRIAEGRTADGVVANLGAWGGASATASSTRIVGSCGAMARRSSSSRGRCRSSAS